MRYFNLSLLALGLLFLQTCRLGSQTVPERLKTSYPPLNDQLARMVTADSLALSPQEAQRLAEVVYIDAREPEEYAVSHLPGAIPLGFNRAKYRVLDTLARDRPLVVYCTVGYRSESMAEKLRRRGFTHVYNLYGSIYAWALAGLPLVDEAGPTDRIHTYDRKWGTYIPDSLATKVH